MPNSYRCRFCSAQLRAVEIRAVNAASRALFVTLLINAVSFAAHAQELDAVRDSLLDDLTRAQQNLTATQQDIAAQRQAFSRRLNQSQNAVLDLRERAVAARRLADEATLSLERIEDRLADWETQSQFQTRLLSAFQGRVSGAPVSVDDDADAMQQGIAALDAFLDEQPSRLYPGWIETEIVAADGRLATAEVLQLGPVHWYAMGGTAGLASASDVRILAALPFAGDELENLASLRATGSGELLFDPTLSEALLLAEQDDTLLEHLQKGGIWVVPILLFALFATLTAAVKGVSLLRLPKLVPALAERLEKALGGGGDVERVAGDAAGMQAELVAIALKPQTSEQRDERLYACLVECRNRLDRWLGAIALTAAVAPLLGLLGTVSGMITTFQLMTLFGSGDASTVSAGISEALVTTELGLVVAIPALLAHALMSRKSRSYYAQLESLAINLSQLDYGRRAA